MTRTPHTCSPTSTTPPNAIVYASGYIPITKMIKTGVYIDVVGIAVVTIPVVHVNTQIHMP